MNIELKKAGVPITEQIFISNERYLEIVTSFGRPANGDILMTAVGTIGSTYMVQNEEFYFKDGNVIWFKNFTNEGFNYYIYDFMQSERFSSIINEITIGSTQNAITIATFGIQKLVIPNNDILKKYIYISIAVNNCVSNKKKLNILLIMFKSILLSKLATIGG